LLQGHEIVANIAYKHLSNQARVAVDQIISQDEVFSGTDEEETPLGKVANWADQVRFEHEFHWTAPLHYVDIPDDLIPGGCPCCQSMNHSRSDVLLQLRSSSTTSSQRRRIQRSSDCTFTYNRDCSKNMCAVGAIYSFSSELVNCISYNTPFIREDEACRSYNTTLSPKQRLMFLTHFVGDIHQPLHVSRKTDKGGNTIDVHFPLQQYSSTRLNERDGLMHSTWNLHSIWDEGIIQHAIALYHEHSQYAFQVRIEELVLDQNVVKPWLICPLGTDRNCVSSWADESWNDALTWSYSNELGQEIHNGDTLSKEYFHTRLEIVERRLAAASVRLSATLEFIFGEKMNDLFSLSI
jgi:hypothetical protein